MSPTAMILLVLLLALFAIVLIDRELRRRDDARRAQLLDAAVRAQAIVEGIPERGVTIRGASRDRSLPGKSRRRARRVHPADVEAPPRRVS